MIYMRRKSKVHRCIFFIFLCFLISQYCNAQLPQEWPYEIGKELDNHFYELPCSPVLQG